MKESKHDKIIMTTKSELVEILREREFELFAIRRNFNELHDKFSQLETAFKINLSRHIALEKELEIHKHGNNSKNGEKENFDNNVDKNSKAKTQLYSSFNKIQLEKEGWKQAYLYEKKVVERIKLDEKKSIDTITDKCENIVKNCIRSNERKLGELSKVNDDAQKQIKADEKMIKASKARENLMRQQILEIANIFDSLKKLEGVKVEALCESATEALKSLANDDEKLYENGLRSLRGVTCDLKLNDQNQSPNILQEQNFVLQQIVKSLKKKLQAKLGEIPEKNEESTTNSKTKNNSCEMKRINEEKEKSEECMKGKTETLMDKSSSSFHKTEEEIVVKEGKNSKSLKMNENNFEEEKICKKINERIDKNLQVEVFESHKNGIPFNEYRFHFFNEKELRIRNSNKLGIGESTLFVEFVNSEKQFHEAPINRTVFFLGENVKEIVNFENSVMHCGVQTRKMKSLEKMTQTMVTGSNGFSRINAGALILNSEKRAIERTVGNLENTVASLKENTLDKARSMIAYNTNYLGDDFFNCIRRLENQK